MKGPTVLYLGGYTHYPVCSRSVSQTLQTLMQLRRECLWQPGPPLRQGTSRGASSCTVSWSMKLQHFSCFAGAACACPAATATATATATARARARPPGPQGRPVTHPGTGGRGRAKDRPGRKPGGGIYCMRRCSAVPAGASFPCLWSSVHPELGPCSSGAQGWCRAAFAAARGRSLLGRAALGTLSWPRGHDPDCAGRQGSDTATFTVGLNIRHATGLAPWFPTHCQGVERKPLATEFRALHQGERTGSLSLSFYMCGKKAPPRITY